MNRSDGLVQRRNVIKEPDNSVSKSNSDDEEPHEENANGLDEDQDSKETRLTLMEEVLLLGLKDKEVR